jgi:hypothetical protein
VPLVIGPLAKMYSLSIKMQTSALQNDGRTVDAQANSAFPQAFLDE